MAEKDKKDNIETDINKIVIMIVALLMSFSLGYVVAENTTSDTADSGTNAVEHHEDGTAHDETAAGEHMHGNMFSVAAEEAPMVDLEVTEDAKSGWNITLTTTNFEFAPDNVNGENVVGEGHAHLYVDGEKVGRLYGPNYHYDVNFDGSKVFRVTLNANDHSEYALENEVIDASVTVTHSHD